MKVGGEIHVNSVIKTDTLFCLNLEAVARFNNQIRNVLQHDLAVIVYIDDVEFCVAGRRAAWLVFIVVGQGYETSVIAYQLR